MKERNELVRVNKVYGLYGPGRASGNTLQTLLNVYQSKSTLDREEIAILMNDESWLTAEEALEKGFIDQLIDLKIENDSAEEVQNFMRSPIMDSFNKVPTGKFKNLFKNTIDYKKISNKLKNKTTE